MRFSQRLGITDVRSALQGRSLDKTTRNRLWSAVAQTVPVRPGGSRMNQTWMGSLYAEIWAEFFKEPVDELPDTEKEIRSRLKEVFLESEWYEVYDLLEFMITSPRLQSRGLPEEATRILKEEHAGFSLINGQFVEITQELEIVAIEEALTAASNAMFAPAHAHLKTALSLLSDRQEPNYRNSMKESISAVEAVAQILTGNPKAELGSALKLVQPPIHGALLSSFRKLYGYTSDAEGIRHALTDKPNLDQADAKFMLVACSAFVSYLIQKAPSRGQ